MEELQDDIDELTKLLSLSSRPNIKIYLQNQLSLLKSQISGLQVKRWQLQEKNTEYTYTYTHIRTHTHFLLESTDIFHFLTICSFNK